MANKLNFLRGFILLPALIFVLAACGPTLEGASSAETPLYNLQPAAEEAGSSAACVECAQATLDAVLTQQQNSMDAQAAATAEAMRANAQATLDSVSATLSAAQTQEQNNANIIAAQVAATAEVDRANAQATLLAAGSTQSAAQTQDAARQTQVQNDVQMTADLATQAANGTATQQSYNALAASTQTAAADLVATQTQSALSTAQAYIDQERARSQKMQNQLTVAAMWCLLILVPVLISLGIGIFLRWTKNRMDQQRIDLQAAQPPASMEDPDRPTGPGIHPGYAPAQPVQPADHVRQWLAEVRQKVLDDKRDNDDDNPGI